MDPRTALSRSASANLQQSPYNNPNMAASAYNGTMAPASYATNHLPPINSQYQPSGQLPPAGNNNYMPQPQYRADPMRSYGQNPSPAGTPDHRYPPHMPPQQQIGSMPQNTMLPQPQSQTPQPQAYAAQPGARPSSYPQPLAPAPPRQSMNDPYGNYGQQERPWAGSDQMPGMTSENGRDPTRTHVVGSQGRRGILPSAPGRPPVMPNGLNGSPKGNTIPQKDADGKFPCPNCTKTYLHAKHLKRHMLRHTGDRPYMCVLCTDTFSRSDILKRHFQKCSVRRGNPTGASHLSNPAAHLKKSQAAAQKAAAAAAQAHATAQQQSGNGQPQQPSNNGTPASSAAVQPSPYTTSMPGNSMPATTASLPAMSSIPYANSQSDNKPPIPQGMQNGQEQNPNGNWAMHNGRGNQMMYNSNTASPAQGGHHVENDWNQFLPQTSNENYMSQMYGYEQAHGDVKNEPHEATNGTYYVPQPSLTEGIAQRATK